MSGDSSLQEIIARVRRLGSLPAEVAKAAAPLVESVAKRAAAAGANLEGQAWRARKDGKPALANAAAAVSARAVGSVVQIFLQGTSTGSSKVQAIQAARRAVLPSGAVPAAVAAEIKRAATEVFERITGAR
jgi:hypothetical protein